MTTLLAFLFMVGVLVFVHEAGHFVAAKVFGVGVPVFSIGMGPRLFGFHWKGTDYRVSALPVGGYVQMSGADPFGEEDVSQYVPPEEDFMRKPVWQRLIIMAAGPGVNLMLPFFLFAVLLMAGRPDVNSRVGVVLPGTPASQVDLRPDDRIVAVDGEPIEIWHDLQDALSARMGSPSDLQLTIEREGAEQTVTLPASALRRDAEGEPDLIRLGIQPFYLSSRVGVMADTTPAALGGLRTGDRLLAVDGVEVTTWDEAMAALTPDRAHTVRYERLDEASDAVAEPEGGEARLDPSVGQAVGLTLPYANPWGLAPVTLFASRVEEGDPAALAGVLPGDRFLRVDGQDVLTFHHFIDLVAQTDKDPSASPRSLELTVIRQGEPVTMSMTPKRKVVKGEPYSRPIIGVASYGRMGVSVDLARKYYGPIEASVRAVDETVEVMRRTLAVLGNMFTGKSDWKDNVGGPVAIFFVAGEVAQAGLFSYATTIGLLSVSIGLINLLPVPVLDGGQIAFYLIEAVRGRPLSLELRERFQMVGVVLLVLFMLRVIVNDVQRWGGL